MKKDRIFLILGILVLILPMTGFSRDSKNLLIYVFGILIFFLSLASIYLNSRNNKKTKSDIFVESSPRLFSEEKVTLDKSEGFLEKKDSNQDLV